MRKRAYGPVLIAAFATPAGATSALSVSNSFVGVFSKGKVTLTDSSVTGSSSVDIWSRAKPILTSTTYGTSLRLQKQSSQSRHVCNGN